MTNSDCFSCSRLIILERRVRETMWKMLVCQAVRYVHQHGWMDGWTQRLNLLSSNSNFEIFSDEEIVITPFLKIIPVRLKEKSISAILKYEYQTQLRQPWYLMNYGGDNCVFAYVCYGIMSDSFVLFLLSEATWWICYAMEYVTMASVSEANIDSALCIVVSFIIQLRD